MCNSTQNILISGKFNNYFCLICEFYSKMLSCKERRGKVGSGGDGGGGDPNKMMLCKFEWNVKTAGHKNITSKGVFSNFSQAIIA